MTTKRRNNYFSIQLLFALIFAALIFGGVYLYSQYADSKPEYEYNESQHPDFIYESYEDHVEITSYKGTSAEVEIPILIDNKPVTTICSSAFEGKTQITSVTLPNNIKAIGTDAFKGCTSLSKINLPDTLSYVGGYAFDGTPWLEGQTDEFVIAGQGVLLKYNGESKSVTVPKGVKSITGAFYDCPFITEIILPSTLEILSENAFYSCTLLKTVAINENPNFVVEDNILYTANKKQLVLCPPQSKKETVEVPDGIENISGYSFANCINLKKVVLPSSVKSIGTLAFDYCLSLEDINFPSSLESVGDGAFRYCDKLPDDIKNGY